MRLICVLLFISSSPFIPLLTALLSLLKDIPYLHQVSSLPDVVASDAVSSTKCFKRKQ